MTRIYMKEHSASGEFSRVGVAGYMIAAEDGGQAFAAVKYKSPDIIIINDLNKQEFKFLYFASRFCLR